MSTAVSHQELLLARMAATLSRCAFFVNSARLLAISEDRKAEAGKLVAEARLVLAEAKASRRDAPQPREKA